VAANGLVMHRAPDRLRWGRYIHTFTPTGILASCFRCADSCSLWVQDDVERAEGRALPLTDRGAGFPSCCSSVNEGDM